MQAYHAIREKLRHPGRMLDLKTRDLIGSDQPFCLLANHNPEFLCVICNGITLFALLSASANQNLVIFFIYNYY